LFVERNLAVVGRLAMGLGAVVLARLAPGLLGLCSRLALGEGGGLALAGAGRRVELAAETLVLGLQATEASLKGLAAGTQDGLHTCMIREAGPQRRRPRPQDRDQRQLHPLNKYMYRFTGNKTKNETDYSRAP
jgi:hypothetical protein